MPVANHEAIAGDPGQVREGKGSLFRTAQPIIGNPDSTESSICKLEFKRVVVHVPANAIHNGESTSIA